MRSSIRTNAEMNTVRKALAARRQGKAQWAPVLLQRQNKNGSWGKPFPVQTLGCENGPEDTIARLTRLNPGRVYRLAD